jgi:putative transcriptional regulator
MQIKNRIAELRRERNLSQQALATLAGCSVGSIVKLEQGQRSNAKISTAFELSKAFGVTVEDIFLIDLSPNGLNKVLS